MKTVAGLVFDTENMTKFICELLQTKDNCNWHHVMEHQEIFITFKGDMNKVRKDVMLNIEKMLGLRQS